MRNDIISFIICIRVLSIKQLLLKTIKSN
jgi:hypothetical protein